MKIQSGTIALITGGASGIGRLMGEIILKKGGTLIIWDIDQEKMDQTVKEFSAYGKVSAYRVDVSDDAAVVAAAEKVKAVHGKVELLINNAGIVTGKYFHEHVVAEIRSSMSVNAIAPMVITGCFLKEMMNAGKGHICNITSSAGLISNPRMSVYAGSKWAATGWSDSLRIEMQILKTGVHVTTVTPFYIHTGMFAGVRSPVIPILDPLRTARKIIRGIEKNRIFLSMPLGVHFIRACQAFLPVRLFDIIAGNWLGIYHTMDHFTGRKK